MRIDHNSYGTVAGAWLAGGAAIILLWLLLKESWVFWPLMALVLVLVLWQTFFFRVPERKPTGSGNIITAVADGKIVIKEKVFEDEYLGKECIQVSIYMNFFDVHANFWPADGTVTYYKYHPGKYFLAFKPKASEENEHASTAIITDAGKEIMFKQLAGTFARRIVCYSKQGLRTKAGEQCGIIKFGSRIDMFFPPETDIRVELGDKVRACETVIALL